VKKSVDQILIGRKKQYVMEASLLFKRYKAGSVYQEFFMDK